MSPRPSKWNVGDVYASTVGESTFTVVETAPLTIEVTRNMPKSRTVRRTRVLDAVGEEFYRRTYRKAK